MLAIIDGDILRYEIGFAAEASVKYAAQDEAVLPTFEYVRELLERRIEEIMEETECEEYKLYITEGESFRYEVAKTVPYKGTRKNQKPWHFKNLTVYMIHNMNTEVVDNGLEADDAMAMAAMRDGEGSVLCSRDKDLRQVPCNFYSWELGSQPRVGPIRIGYTGELQMDGKKLFGTGGLWLQAQMLMGDSADNIPGLPGVGPVRAYNLLKDCSLEEAQERVRDMYREYKGDEWEEYYKEQNALLRLVY